VRSSSKFLCDLVTITISVSGVPSVVNYGHQQPRPSLSFEQELSSVDTLIQSADQTYVIVSLLIYSLTHLAYPKDTLLSSSLILSNAQLLFFYVWLGTVTFMYRVGQKSKLILNEYVNKTEKVGGMWTTTNSYRKMKHCLIFSREIFYITIVWCLNILWL